jgi:MoxR-like ATPase
MTAAAIEDQAQTFRHTFQKLRSELSKVIVGQEEIIENVLVAFFAAGHILLEGVPGLGKTILVRTLADAVNLKFARIQFTPDLMPSDIIGTNIITEETGVRLFKFQPGPVFANVLLADEINRATPKTQSALLEAMQEHHVTVAGTTYPVDDPFLVLATQNPIEMEGTYPLPEAQLDRFFFKLRVEYPAPEELHTIIERTTTGAHLQADKVIGDPSEINALRDFVRQVPVAREIQDHAVKLLLATHPHNVEAGTLAKKYVRYGASPRGVQAIILAAKIYALLDGRYHVAADDIRRAAVPALRHRIILNFAGEAEGKTAEDVLTEILAGRF